MLTSVDDMPALIDAALSVTNPVAGTCNDVETLSALDVLVVDCQATAAAPRGHLLEIGWGRADASTTHVHARLIALPEGGTIPAAVARLTGISESMARDGMDVDAVWRELSNEAAAFSTQPTPARTRTRKVSSPAP